jgi:hypothetical protein
MLNFKLLAGSFDTGDHLIATVTSNRRIGVFLNGDTLKVTLKYFQNDDTWVPVIESTWSVSTGTVTDVLFSFIWSEVNPKTSVLMLNGSMGSTNFNPGMFFDGKISLQSPILT